LALVSANLFLELIGGIDLDGLHVVDESGLGVKRRLCSCLNSGLHISLHINGLRDAS
jgi:hypothetical protein